MKGSWVVFFFAIRNVINVLFPFFSLGDASWTWISAWAMKVSWEEGVFAIGNVINVLFSFLFFRGHFLNLDFSLGYEGKLRVVFFSLPLGTSLTFLFLFFL